MSTCVGTRCYTELNFVGSSLGGSAITMQRIFQNNPLLEQYLQQRPYYISLRPVINQNTGGKPGVHNPSTYSADYSVLAESLGGFVAQFPNLVAILSYPIGRQAIPMLLFAGFSSRDEAKHALFYNESSPSSLAVAIPIVIAGDITIDPSRKDLLIPNINLIPSTEPYPSQQEAYLSYNAIGPYWYVEPTLFGHIDSNSYQDITNWIFPRADNANDLYVIAWSANLTGTSASSNPPPRSSIISPPSGGTPYQPSQPRQPTIGGASSFLDQPGVPILIAAGVGLIVWMVAS